MLLHPAGAVEVGVMVPCKYVWDSFHVFSIKSLFNAVSLFGIICVSLKYLGRFLQDMESIVETMMQQLLSKEILQEPMKEIGERYPKWLEDHKASLSAEEYERYSRQYILIKDLNEVYENDPSNFNRVVELMQKMQECGQPPNDIVQELAPDFDLASLGQM